MFVRHEASSKQVMTRHGSFEVYATVASVAIAPNDGPVAMICSGPLYPLCTDAIIGSTNSR